MNCVGKHREKVVLARHKLENRSGDIFQMNVLNEESSCGGMVQ